MSTATYIFRFPILTCPLCRIHSLRLFISLPVNQARIITIGKLNAEWSNKYHLRYMDRTTKRFSDIDDSTELYLLRMTLYYLYANPSAFAFSDPEGVSQCKSISRAQSSDSNEPLVKIV